MGTALNNSEKILGKPWENLGENGKIIGKMFGKSWKNLKDILGKTEILAKFFRKY
jgi:hypothetical protein